MKSKWNEIVITKISVALYVPPNTGKPVHNNRPYHGFVLNNSDHETDYCFSDGYTLHTKGSDLFYLPKGSSYYTRNITSGGCYAINFDADINDTPFIFKVKNPDLIKKNFKIACDEWHSNSLSRNAATMGAIYNAIFQAQKKSEEIYAPHDKILLISPAIEMIDREFTSSLLSVSALASLCGVSVVYFRKIFTSFFGVSPKEYIISKRMEYAKNLLSSREFDISKISELCGYPEPCHFSREFKKRFGISPTNYR